MYSILAAVTLVISIGLQMGIGGASDVHFLDQNQVDKIALLILIPHNTKKSPATVNTLGTVVTLPIELPQL